MRIKATTLDGKTYDFNVDHFAPTADRVAFEKQFQLNLSVMSKYFDEDGKPRDNVEGFREEWMAFLVWRAVRRHDPSVGDFDSFIDNANELVVGDPEEEGGKQNPTESDPSEAPTTKAAPMGQVVQLGS